MAKQLLVSNPACSVTPVSSLSGAAFLDLTRRYLDASAITSGAREHPLISSLTPL